MFRLTTVLCVLLIGCDGELHGLMPMASGADAGTPDADAGIDFPEIAPLRYACHDAPSPADLPLKRVSTQSYRRAVRSVAQALVGADTHFLDDALALVPDDVRIRAPGDSHGGFTRLDQSIQQVWVDKTFAVAQVLANEATKTADRRASWAGSCATNSSTTDDATCLRSAMQKLATLTLRRTPTSSDVDFLLTVTSPSAPVRPDSLANAIAFALISPDFLYDAERGTGGTWALDDEALARRLAALMWQGAPDQTLIDAAHAGALRTDDGLRTQFRRMLADSRAIDGIGLLFAEWLRLPETPRFDLESGQPAWEHQFAQLGITAATHQHANDDVLGAALHAVKSGGSLATFLADDAVYSPEADLAGLYGVQNSIQKPSDRAGLITRPAIVASGGARTRPIMKGYFVRNALLCTAISLPNDPVLFAQATSSSATPTGDGTTRDHVTTLTTSTATCASCHSRLLNPAGFATENFDGLGRARTHEQLFGADGGFLGEAPVDTRGAANVIVGDDQETNDARGLTAKLIKSGLVETCFVRNVFRFTFQRLEDEATADGCLLAEAESQARAGASLADVLERFVISETFRNRRTEVTP